MAGGEVGKDASKEGTMSTVVVRPSFCPDLEQPPYRCRRRPNPTKEAGSGEGLVAAPPGPMTVTRSAGRGPPESPLPAGTDKAG